MNCNTIGGVESSITSGDAGTGAAADAVNFSQTTLDDDSTALNAAATPLAAECGGSYFLCTEISPRCFVIRKVSTKNVRHVYNNLNAAVQQQNQHQQQHHYPQYQQIGSDLNENSHNQLHSNYQQQPNQWGPHVPYGVSDKDGCATAVAIQGGASSPYLTTNRVTSCIPPLPLLNSWWCVPAAPQFDNFNALTNDLNVEDSYNGNNQSQLPSQNQQQNQSDSALNGCMVQLSLAESPPTMVNSSSNSSAVIQNGTGGGLVEYVPIDLESHHNEASACLPSDLPPLNGDNNVNHSGNSSNNAASPTYANNFNLKSPVDYYDTAPNNVGGSDLRQCLKNQLEYYFSRENLAVDAYLKSQMDNDQFVPIRIVANFNKVRKLTNDINLIIAVLRESPHVQVDEKGEKVRPVCKRCTLVLREIPAGTEKHEIEQMFNAEKCPKVVSCEYAHNNSWYVNFETDEDAQRAFMHLRQMATFKEKPIHARIKNAPMPRMPSSVVNSNGYCAVPSTLVLPLVQNSAQLTYNSNNGVTVPPSAAGTSAVVNCGHSTPTPAVAAAAPTSTGGGGPPPQQAPLVSAHAQQQQQPQSGMVSAADAQQQQHHGQHHSQQHQSSQQPSKMIPQPHNPPMDPVGAAHSVAGLSTALTTMPNLFFYAAPSPRTITAGFSAAAAHVPPPAAVVAGPPATAAMISAAPAAWTSAPGMAALPAFFDLSHLLAVNGLQPHSTFRPTGIQGIQVLLPAPAPLARPMGTANFVERTRNKRNASLGTYYPTHPGYNRSSSTSMESRRPPAAMNTNNGPYHQQQPNHYQQQRQQPHQQQYQQHYTNGIGGGPAGMGVPGLAGLGALNGGHATTWNDNSLRHLPNNRSSFSGGAYPGFGGINHHNSGPPYYHRNNNYNNNNYNNHNNNNSHHMTYNGGHLMNGNPNGGNHHSNNANNTSNSNSTAGGNNNSAPVPNNGRGGANRDRSNMSSSDYWSSKDFNSAKNNRKQKVSAANNNAAAAPAASAGNAPSNLSTIPANSSQAPTATAQSTSNTNTANTAHQHQTGGGHHAHNNEDKDSSNKKSSAANQSADKNSSSNNFDFQPSSFPPLAETDVPQQNAKMSYADMAKHAVVNNSASANAAANNTAVVSGTASEGGSVKHSS